MLDLKPIKEIYAKDMVKATKKEEPFVVRKWFRENPCPITHSCWKEISKSVLIVPDEISTVSYTTHAFRANGIHRSMRLKEVLERIKGIGEYPPVVTENELYYVFAGHLPKGLKNSFEWPKELNYGHGATFIASKGLKVKAHADFAWIYLVQVEGDKKVKLFPPSDYKYMYPYTKEPVARPRRSLVDLDNPDFNEYPLLKKTNGQVVTLHEGDLLYIPVGWMHEMDTFGYSIGCNRSVHKSSLTCFARFVEYCARLIWARVFYDIKPLDVTNMKQMFKFFKKALVRDIKKLIPKFAKKRPPHTSRSHG